MKIGDQAQVTRRFDATDLTAYATLSGHPSHGDTVPEPLIGALFSFLLGVHLPGPGANYLKQETRFIAPVALATELTASVEIIRLRPDKRLVDLATRCTDTSGRLLAEGRALIRVPDPARWRSSSD